MKRSLPPVDATEAEVAERAREIGFSECVRAMRRVLLTTPAGWPLVALFVWQYVPHSNVLAWLGGFFCCWLAGLLCILGVERAGPKAARHGLRVLAVAVLDGACWGGVGWVFMGYDPFLDVRLGAVLCGVAAVNAPVYLTWFRAYATLICALWLSLVLAATWNGMVGRNQIVTENLVGLTIFCALLVVHMRTVAGRVHEAITLRLRNASLAKQLSEALAQVRHEAGTDALTGQVNRRGLDQLLAEQAGGSRSFCVLMLDIDHFKLVNDTHGHAAGDDTLRAFARRVREHLREGDICARYGGEEFVVVLPGTTLPVALEVAERLRQGVAAASLISLPLVRATVSIGVAQHRAGETAEQLLARADAGVYAAKHGGRNQVRVPEEAVPA